MSEEKNVFEKAYGGMVRGGILAGMTGMTMSEKREAVLNNGTIQGIELENYLKTIEETNHKPIDREHQRNVENFRLIAKEMVALYARKNLDYGNSFSKSLDEDGLLVVKIRLGDKLNRFSRLIKNPSQVKDETLRDTLIDLATYAAMAVQWMDEQEVKEPGIVCGYNFKEDDKHSCIQGEWVKTGSGSLDVSLDKSLPTGPIRPNDF